MKDYNTLTDEERDLIDELQYLDFCMQKTSRKEHWPSYRKRRIEIEKVLLEKGVLEMEETHIEEEKRLDEEMIEEEAKTWEQMKKEIPFIK